MTDKAQPCSPPSSIECSQSNRHLNGIRLVTQSAEVVIEAGFTIPASTLDYQPPFPSLTSNWHNAPYSAIDPSQPSLSIAGKTDLVTGGGRGIGSQIAHAFAKAGASVMGITGRTESALQSTKESIEQEFPSTKVLTFTADVVDEPAINAAFAAVKDASNDKQDIDIAILNAGYFPDSTPIAQSSSTSAEESSAATKEWWKGFEVNVLGACITTRAFLANVYAKSSSNAVEPVLIAASTSGIYFSPPFPNFSGYGTSKVAATQFFQSVGVENPDVRVISFHAGVVQTDMGKKGEDAGLQLPPDDIQLPAHFAVWLASKDANFLKNKMVWCNWDIEELKAKEKITADPAYLNIGMNGWPYQS